MSHATSAARRPDVGTLTAALLVTLAAAGCGLPPPDPRVRVLEATPSGSGIDPAAEPAIRFTGAVASEGFLDERRFLVVRANALAQALAAVESEEGASQEVPHEAGETSLDDGATRVRFRPGAPLPPGTSFALVLSSRARSAEGTLVLDAQGRPRPTVVQFATAPLPPPDVLLTEVLADAATPEAGGEYVEVLGLGPGPLDLAGWRFEKRSTTGSWSGCTVGPGNGGPVPPGGVALIVGGSWDGRYPLPEGTVTFPCGATSLAGGIANDRPPVLRLLDPSGAIAAELDANVVPLCAQALEADPAPDGSLEATCCRCTEGSPGEISSPEE